VNDAVIATVRHPYFKQRWLGINKACDAESQRNSAKKLLMRTAATFHEITQADDDYAGASDGDEYFGFGKSSSASFSADINVLAYLNDYDRAFTSLKKHLLIKSIFIRCNTTFSSSAPVERLFSFVGITMIPKRNVLSDNTFETLVLLRCNSVISNQETMYV
jgi:hypothetical protein